MAETRGGARLVIEDPYKKRMRAKDPGRQPPKAGSKDLLERPREKQPCHQPKAKADSGGCNAETAAAGKDTAAEKHIDVRRAI